MSRVLVTVGTDHHPFRRLVEWGSDFAERHPEHDVFIQYGAAAPPRHGESSRVLDHAQLQTEIARADAVVCHGGPATITEVRRSGLTPICLPRCPARGEHVDGHQKLFVDHLVAADIVVASPGVDELDGLVLAALANARTAAAAPPSLPPGAARLGAFVAELAAPRAPKTDLDPVRVVYIGGQGRSGTTLMERSLGELPGVFSIGEAVHLWDRGLRDNQLCGCGRPFGSCPFWQDVGDVAFGGWHTLDPAQAVSLRFSVDRNRYLPLLARPGLSARYQRRHAAYVGRLARLYRAIAEVSGCQTIVDSSKHASYAGLLSQTPGIELRVLHVVRDSRAVAHAWTKQVSRPEAGGTPMPVYKPAQAALLWNAQNTAIEWLGTRQPYLRLRYEDFVESPKDCLLEAAAFAGLGDDVCMLGFLDGETITLGSSHTVAGNPMRFQTGKIPLRSDQSWVAEMPAARRQLVATLTRPLQRKYGYGSSQL